MSDTLCPTRNGLRVALSEMFVNIFHLHSRRKPSSDTYVDMENHDYFVSCGAFESLISCNDQRDVSTVEVCAKASVLLQMNSSDQNRRRGPSAKTTSQHRKQSSIFMTITSLGGA